MAVAVSIEFSQDAIIWSLKGPGKTSMMAWVAGLWLAAFCDGRIDREGWPTRDAAAAEEDG